MFQFFAKFIVGLLGLSGRAAASVEFWIYDSLKIAVIMGLVIFGVSFLRTYLPPEKIRKYLQGRNKITGYLLASLFGVVSPFCSCSTIPLFLGMVGAGVPFGMTITFLFVSPMVNEAALVVLFTNLGWQVAVSYLAGGVLIGIAGGWLLSGLGFEKYIVEFEFGKTAENKDNPNLKTRVLDAYRDAKKIVLQILPYVLVGVAVGAWIHGYLPDEFIQNTLQGAYAVPLAVVVGVPIYTNIMGAIPVAESLIGKGLAIGTAVAFLMSVAALSLPQFIMLKRVMKKKLILAYGAIIALGIMLLGSVFNLTF